MALAVSLTNTSQSVSGTSWSAENGYLQEDETVTDGRVTAVTERWCRGHVLLHSARLTHQQGFAKVATGLVTYSFGQFRREEQPLLLTDRRQDAADLGHGEGQGSTETGALYDGRRTSSVVGRGTLMARHRLRIGPMTLEVDVEHRIRRQVAMYFSIVRRKACWASFVSLSTSVSSTTEGTDQHVNGGRTRGGFPSLHL